MSSSSAGFCPIRRRRLLALAAALCAASGCSAGRAGSTGSAQDAVALRRFEGLGVVLVVDAVPGAELKRVEFIDDRGMTIFTSATVAQRNRAILALGSVRVPPTVRVRWREGAGWDSAAKRWNEGTVTGDHTVALASRIPAEVTDSLRRGGGALRLKFRLRPEGVLFGWDIERAAGSLSRFDMPGGDFLDTRY